MWHGRPAKQDEERTALAVADRRRDFPAKGRQPRPGFRQGQATAVTEPCAQARAIPNKVMHRGFWKFSPTGGSTQPAVKSTTRGCSPRSSGEG
mmetsp:Transcript_62392/g.146294  ORF Transcript_62392/g.146294 Transcript_62392/m.146294 type:complete len:93 (+) Transcript_62392:754-1032(+)